VVGADDSNRTRRPTTCDRPFIAVAVPRRLRAAPTAYFKPLERRIAGLEVTIGSAVDPE
jgi:hypothetical protein